MSHAEIKEAYEAGETGEYSHMLIGRDMFDYEDYPVYIEVGNDPRSYKPSNSESPMGDQIMECYSYARGWAAQSGSGRVNNWGYEPADQQVPAADGAADEELFESADDGYSTDPFTGVIRDIFDFDGDLQSTREDPQGATLPTNDEAPKSIHFKSGLRRGEALAAKLRERGYHGE